MKNPLHIRAVIRKQGEGKHEILVSVAPAGTYR